MQNDTKPLLSVRNLKTSFFQDEGTTKAVDGASFDVFPGKTSKEARSTAFVVPSS